MTVRTAGVRAPRARWLPIMVLLLVGATGLPGCTGGAVGTGGAAAGNEEMARLVQQVSDRHSDARFGDYYVVVDSEPGFESVSLTNYPPSSLPVPAYQEVVTYAPSPSGQGAGLVCSVWLSRGANEYVVVEFDGLSDTEVSRDGAWFLDEVPESYVNELAGLMRRLITDS